MSHGIQQLISVDAISTLTSVVPGADAGEEKCQSLAFPSRQMDRCQFRQVLLASLPLLAADFLSLAGVYLSAALLLLRLTGEFDAAQVWDSVAVLCISHAILGQFRGLFPASGMNPVCELRGQISSIAGAFLILFAFNGIVDQPDKTTETATVTMVLAFLMAVLVAPVSRFCTRRMFAPLAWWGEKVIVVGSGQYGQSVYQFLKKIPQRGLKPLGVVDCSPSDYWSHDGHSDIPFLGTTDELFTICRKHQCHWVIAAVADRTHEEVQRILNQGVLIPNLVVLNSTLMIPALSAESFEAAGLAGALVRGRLLSAYHRRAKRLFDTAVAGLLLLLLSPLFMMISVWLSFKSQGSVFFGQRRIGRFGKPFQAWKFRTMVPDAEQALKTYLAENPAARTEWDSYQKLRHDPRIIPGIGSFLRRTSLDELPQLWNVLVGDMSLVGPRPCTPEQIKLYRDLYPFYIRMRPGITGLWQVSGRNYLTYTDRVWMDTYYVTNWSMWFDYFILLRTVKTVICREGSC